LADSEKNDRSPHTLVINADNGSENNGVRTQWLRRLVEFSVQHRVIVRLACYPPYHSKYNPVERVFGVLENYWNGDPLLSVDHALGMSAAMTYKGIHPTSIFIARNYAKGVSLSKKEMKPYERSIERLEGLEKWFLTITPDQASRQLEALALSA